MLNRKKRTLTQILFASAFFLGVFLPNSSIGQGSNRINSPYSMFGPGEIVGNQYFRNLSLGGISQGFRSNVSVNHLNPASYTAIDSLSFVFEGTVFSHIYQQKMDDREQTTSASYMANLNFAFPIRRGWRMAAGLMPYSQTGYRISDYQQDEINGRINYFYEGRGGINKVFMGHGFSIFRGLSVGFNAAYLFGNITDNRLAQSDSAGFFRTSWNYADNIDGLMLQYGAQWQFQTGEQQRITLGASFSPKAVLNVEQSRIITRALQGVTGTDTLSIITGEKGKMEIPSSLSAGAFMVFNRNWAAGLDVQTQQWSRYKVFDEIQGLNDSYQLRFGVVHNPQIQTFSGYFSRIQYRAGLRYGQSFLQIADPAGSSQDFTEFGIAFGVGLPLRGTLSAINLGFEYSQRSSDSQNLIDENFFRFNIGINVYERWFVRRRFL